ncbi:hypothetical protein A2U01_0000417 [Trifolium medium]|uniref:Uncharacterized protein n=1 Tax=Trifolium medium TaxID=97028 RepID=A0A392LZA6_9FABA|nr:hypothetical protein [Trifolium medium]
MPISKVEVETIANIDNDKITAAKAVYVVVLVESPISDMTTTVPREIRITKENQFTIDIHNNDKADDIVLHQESEIDIKQYYDEHGYTVYAGQYEKVSVCSDWSDLEDVPET